jgi:UDP-N-acetylglucosamine--N-acetylmuramyl-(pentapeptide) pyrophosphoryl-undecaprenol N-acetylglucosamine transferase
LPTTEFEHELLDLHPLYRSRPWRNWRSVATAATSWRKLRRILREVSPAVVLGTGGYASGLALAAGLAARIPILLQEQNSYPGLTMRFFSRRAREVYLGFPEAADHLRVGANTRLVHTGNPIEPPPAQRQERASALAHWKLPSDAQRVLLVVGGSQGAHPINEAVAGALPTLASSGVCVIWATGKARYGAYRHLESDVVKVVSYLSPIASAYAVANFAVGRAGAVTTAELCAWGIPSLLVPLPSAAADHQTTNAEALARAGCAVVLKQVDLTTALLAARLQQLFGDAKLLESMRTAALGRGRPEASQHIAQQILKICHVK